MSSEHSDYMLIEIWPPEPDAGFWIYRRTNDVVSVEKVAGPFTTAADAVKAAS